MHRWPEREFEIRRRQAADPDFRAMVADYEEVCAALQRWRIKDPPDPRMIAEYEGLVWELEEEIQGNLEQRETS